MGIKGPLCLNVPSSSFSLEAPAAPVNLTLSNVGNSSVLYTAWGEPPGGRDHYRMVLYSLVPPGMERVRVVQPSTQDFLWMGLPSGSQFAVQVITVKGQAEAPSTIAVEWTCESDRLSPIPRLRNAPVTI